MAEPQLVQSTILQPVATEPVQPTRQRVLWPSTTATDTTISSVPTCPPTPCQHDYTLQLVPQWERKRQTERQIQQPTQRIQGPRQEQIGTAQHGGCSDSDSWPTKNIGPAAKDFMQHITYTTPVFLHRHWGFNPRITKTQPHSFTHLLVGDRRDMHFDFQWNFWHKPHSHGRHLGRRPKRTRREDQRTSTPQHDYTFNSRTTMQRPLKDTRCTTRNHGTRWVTATAHSRHRTVTQITSTRIPVRDLNGKRDTPWRCTSPLRRHHGPMGITTNRLRRSGWEHGIQASPLVEHHPLAGNPEHHLDTDTLAAHLAETRTIRQAIQSHCNTPSTLDSHQRLGNTEHTNTGWHLPLLNNSGTNRRRTTTSTTRKRRPSNLGQVANEPQTVSSWQYKPQYLTRYKDNEWTTLSPIQRERLMRLPDDFTQNNRCPNSDRQRNTVLGNAWHLPTAIWLLFLLLLPNTDAIPYPPTIPAIDQMTTAWLNNPCPFGPPERATGTTNMPQLDWQSHLRWARQQAHLAQTPKPIDPTLNWALDIQKHLDMPTIRTKVINEIQTMIQQQEEETTHWHLSLPAHCQIAYKQKHMITQIPVLIQLLQKLQYPHTHIFDQELSQGFQLLGRLQPGLQWHVRDDNKYKQPRDIEELRQHNREYIQKKLTQPHIDTHWEFMAEEIAAEVKSGRMRGPFEAPAWFPRPTTHLRTPKHTLQKQPLPHQSPIIAMAFSIQQTGSDDKPKIRRGEDWRRSGHSSACQMDDQPYHHTPDHYISLAQHLYHHIPHTHTQTVWGHDHDGAYRQLPLRDPEVAYVLLQTPDGPTLWHHHVLLFGSAASVWAYNRFGDMLTHISRCICGIPVLHYVDDYGSINHNHKTQRADSIHLLP